MNKSFQCTFHGSTGSCFDKLSMTNACRPEPVEG